MRTLLIAVLFLAACEFVTDSDEGAAIGDGADAGPADLTPPDAECPAYGGTGMVCLGSFEVRNFADIELLSTCARITGDLDLGANGLVEISLPLLERVDGTVTLSNSFSLERIALPELKEIGLGLEARGPLLPLLTELAVPRLRTVGGGMYVTPSSPMTEWSLPCLDSIGDFAVFQVPTATPRLIAIGGDLHGTVDGPLLESVGGELLYIGDQNLPSLIRVRDLTLLAASSFALPALRTVVRRASLGCNPTSLPSFDTLSLPALRRAGSIQFCQWPELAAVEVPALQRITGPASLGGLSVGVPAVTSLPALTTIVGPATFSSTIDLPVLTTAGALTVYAPVTVPSLTSSGTLVLYDAFAAPALASVAGNITAYGAIDLPSLATVSSHMNLRGDSGTLIFPALTSVGGRLDVLDTQAPELRAPLLASIGEFLRIQANPALANIELSSLASLGGYLRISANPELPTCQATNLRDQLIAAGWTGFWTITSNGTGTCP